MNALSFRVDGGLGQSAMNITNYYNIYRRMIATATDDIVNWWYSGWTFVQIAGQPAIPLMQVAAIMTYRCETLATDCFRIHWSEIGAFRDPSTGELPTEWINPLTGTSIKPPRSFKEGPGHTTVSATANGVALEIQQPHATLRDSQVSFRTDRGRMAISQRERKVRGFPAVDGRLPAAGSATSFESVTELSFFADLAPLQGSATAAIGVQGVYSFTLLGIAPWMGFGDLTGLTITRGRITRAAPGFTVDATSWRRLAELFPVESSDPPAARQG